MMSRANSHTPLLCAFFRDEVDACEVVINVYKQVWGGASKFDEQRGSAATWIVVLARSRAMDRRRFRAARSRSAVKVKELRDVISSHSSPEALAIATQSNHSVTRALAEVPQEQREALELAFYRGFSHSEILERTPRDRKDPNPAGLLGFVGS